MTPSPSDPKHVLEEHRTSYCDTDVPVRTLQGVYDDQSIRWKASPFRKYILSVVYSRLGTYSIGSHHVENAICLGLGSFRLRHDDEFGDQVCKRMLQLIFFLDVVDVLQTLNNGSVELQLFAQDPGFTLLDVEFLSRFNIVVVECPRAADHITPGTFLFTPWMPVTPLLASALAGRDPMLYVGHDLYRLAEHEFPEGARFGYHRAKDVGEAGVEIAKSPAALRRVARVFLTNRSGRRFGADVPKCDEGMAIDELADVEDLLRMWMFVRTMSEA